MTNEPHDVDYIIVGQGLAGTCLANSLLLRNQKIVVVDADNGKQCSSVAVGAYNPLTFRTFSPTWKALELVPEAIDFYKSLEVLLKTKLVNERPILKVISNEDQRKLWLQKAEKTDASHFMHYELLKERKGVYADFGLGKVKWSGNINMSELLEKFRAYLQSNRNLLEERFDDSALKLTDSGVVYKNINAKGVIYCEGHQCSSNKYFTHVPFKKAKGEILIIECVELKMQEILHDRINIVPIGDNLYWVGSTYEWNDMELVPSETARENLESQVKKVIKYPFKIVDQKVGIRPTVKDRRPVLGNHETYDQLFVFNGLGTRGVTLGPHYSKQLVSFILDETKLDREVDYLRFIESK